MNNEQKIVAFGLTLAFSLAIVWYFSRKRSVVVSSPDSTSANDVNADSTPNQFTFNLPPVSIPPITVPNLGNTGNSSSAPTASANSCCRNCGGTAQTSPPSSGSLISAQLVSPQIAANTQSAVSSSTYEPLILPNSGGQALPNPVLWQRDPNYRVAYVMAYNDQVGLVQQEIKNRCIGFVLPDSCYRGSDPQPVSLDVANNASTSALNSFSTNVRGGISADLGSTLYTEMLQKVQQYLQLYSDDPNHPSNSNSQIGTGLVPLG